MDINALDALKNLEVLTKVKQRQVFCPMIKRRALVTPLMTSDDLALRTTLASPDLYDLELSKLVWKHTTWPDLTDDNVDFESFLNYMSYIDRSVLLWGLFNSTYGTLGVMTIKCPHCDHEFNDEITAEQILQEDSITPWEHDVPFNEHVYKIENIVNLEGFYKFVFDTSIPTVRQHIDILSLIPMKILKENYQKNGSLFSKTEELVSITRHLTMFRTENDQQPVIWSFPKDIHMVVSRFVTMEISDDIISKYNDNFNKYVPVFRKPYTCPNCTNKFDYIADPEVSLFRQFLRRR